MREGRHGHSFGSEYGAAMSRSPERLRVLLFTPAMKLGGAQSFVSSLLDRLDRDEFAPQLAVMSGAEMDYVIPADVDVSVTTEIESVECALDLDWPRHLIAELSGEAAWVEAEVQRICALVTRIGPDIVFCSPEWASVLAAAASMGFPPSTRLICRVDAPASMAFPKSGVSHLLRELACRHLNRADRIVVVSEAIAQDLIDNFESDPSRIVVMNNAVDVSKAQMLGLEPVTEVAFDDGVPSVVFVGRIERVKGLSFLLRAMAKVIEQMPARCILVGGGTQEDYLRALARHLGIEDSVHFVGSQTNPFRFMSRATTFVLPSLSEGMPTVLIEAMACGCPVVATDIAGGAVRKLLNDGDCGLIVPREDVDGLATALTRVLKDESLRETLIRKGSERARDFDLPRIISENQDLMRAVATEPPIHSQSHGSPQQAGDAEGERTLSGLQGAVGERLLRRLGDRARSSKFSKSIRIMRQRGLRAFGSRLIHEFRTSGLPGARLVRSSADQARRVRASVAAHDPAKVRLCVLVSSVDEKSLSPEIEILLRHFDRDGLEVCLVRVHDASPTAVIPPDVEQYIVEPRFVPGAGSGLPEPIASSHAGEVEWMTATSRGLGALSRELGCDAIFAVGFDATILLGLARKHLPQSTATISAMRSYAADFAGQWELADLVRFMIHEYLPGMDAVLAPTQSIADDLVQQMGIAADKVVLVPDPVETIGPAVRNRAAAPSPDVHKWFSSGGPVFFSAVSTDSPAELTCLLEALAVARRDEDIRCAISGVVGSRDGVPGMLQGLGIADQVMLLGNVNVDDLLGESWAYVDLGAEKAACVSTEVVSAVADGLPVISMSHHDATWRFLGEGKWCLPVPRGDAEALAEAMLQLAWDRASGERIAASAREYLDSVAADSVAALVGDVVVSCSRRRASQQAAETL